ncbi:HEAT repeat [anaerobic digester metagenome]
MPYLICEQCNIYYEVNSEEEITKFGNCECGNPLNYYESLELYLKGRGKIKRLPQHETIIGELLDFYESTVLKIILYAVKELPYDMERGRVIGFLRGSRSAFIVDENLNQLKTYSVLSGISRKKMDKLIEILVEKKFLKTRTIDQYPNNDIVSLTDEGNSFIFNKESLDMGLFENKNVDLMIGVDEDLYRKLRGLRNRIAEDIEMPGYIVCANAPLIEMARKFPVDRESMLSIKGIGKKFMVNYGESFLNLIKTYKSGRRFNDNLISIKSKPQRMDKKPVKIEDPFDFHNILLNDPRNIMRTHTAFILGESRDSKHVDVLCQATKDSDGNVRRLAAAALGKIGEKRAEDALINLLDDPKPQVRQYAATSLGKIRSEKALPFLKKLDNDPVIYVQEKAEWAIQKIRND